MLSHRPLQIHGATAKKAMLCGLVSDKKYVGTVLNIYHADELHYVMNECATNISTAQSCSTGVLEFPV